MIFPLAARNMAGIEQAICDVAIARAIEARIERAQSEYQTVNTRFGQCARIGTGIAAGYGSPQSDRGRGTDFEELVERQKYGRRVCAVLVRVDAKYSVVRAFVCVARLKGDRREPKFRFGKIWRKAC